MTAFDPRPVVLEGSVVRLEPLALAHAPGLLAAAASPEIWQWLTIPQPTRIEDTQAFVRAALDQQERGVDVPFAVVLRAGDRVVGSTRYMDIARADFGLEIGWTWYARDVWRSPVNTECKHLLMSHAFDVLGAARVQLKTDARNERSQRAIERIGATKEGVLRRHRRLHTGFLRDSVIYSVIREEWPAVKARLDALRAPARG
ncbi:MAG: GNAT family N-acetyltransferase [Planctomycetes bacterium]|nr:GNAT family N-acetyltransferase [Planctomycetota bacterium]